MKKKSKKKVTKRNGYAKALESPVHRPKVIPNKKKSPKEKYLKPLSHYNQTTAGFLWSGELDF